MDLAQAFLAPRNTAHRQYEALRACFVEGLPASEVARRFGYTVGSFHQLAHRFRNDPKRQFFIDNPRPGVKADGAVREEIIRLRKQNLSIYDISRALKKEGVERTPAGVAKVLKEEGFAKLPRRADEGLALFAGLNVIPKRSFLTEYSCRIPPGCYPKLMRHWFDAMTRLGLEHGSSSSPSPATAIPVPALTPIDKSI